MNEKCNKYESLFIFGSEQDLEEHLKDCPDCQKEHESMKAVAGLVKEAAPFIRRKPSNTNLFLKIAAGFTVLILCSLVIRLNHSSFEATYNSDLALVKENSIVTQMGLPTDEYGLLAVESN